MWTASYVQNTSVKPDRSSWKIRSEKLLEGNLSTSLLDESNHSDAARSSSIDSVKWSDCGDRVKPCTGVVRKRHGGSWVSHVPLQKIDMKNEIWSRYVKGTSPFDITVTSGRLRWHRNQSHTCAPCWIHTYISWWKWDPEWFKKLRNKIPRVLEVLHLFRCFTHTHVNSAWRMRCWPKLGRCRPINMKCCDFDPSCPHESNMPKEKFAIVQSGSRGIMITYVF